MRPNPTNFVGYGTCGQAALLQRKCGRGVVIPSEEVHCTFHIPHFVGFGRIYIFSDIFYISLRKTPNVCLMKCQCPSPHIHRQNRLIKCQCA